MTTGVRDTGLMSFIVVTFSCFGTGIILKVFEMLGIEDVDKDRLKMWNSCDAQVFFLYFILPVNPVEN